MRHRLPPGPLRDIHNSEYLKAVGVMQLRLRSDHSGYDFVNWSLVGSVDGVEQVWWMALRMCYVRLTLLTQFSNESTTYVERTFFFRDPFPISNRFTVALRRACKTDVVKINLFDLFLRYRATKLLRLS